MTETKTKAPRKPKSKAAKSQKKDRKYFIYCEFPKELYEQLEERAEENLRTINREVLYLCTKGIKNETNS